MAIGKNEQVMILKGGNAQPTRRSFLKLDIFEPAAVSSDCEAHHTLLFRVLYFQRCTPSILPCFRHAATPALQTSILESPIVLMPNIADGLQESGVFGTTNNSHDTKHNKLYSSGESSVTNTKGCLGELCVVLAATRRYGGFI